MTDRTSSTTRCSRTSRAAERREPPREPPRTAARRHARRDAPSAILVALPWIAFAIAIVVAGGDRLRGRDDRRSASLCLREFLAMTADAAADPASPPTSPSPALVVAAHFGTAFNILLVLAAAFPVLFAFGARRAATATGSPSRWR